MIIFSALGEFWTSHIGDIFIIAAFIALVSEIWLQSRKINTLREELNKSMTNESYYDELVNVAKEKLKTEGDVKAIKYLRMRTGMSMVDAKELIDSLK